MCTPVDYFWVKSVQGHCFNPEWVYFSNAPFQIVTDFAIFGLPLPTLPKGADSAETKTGSGTAV